MRTVEINVDVQVNRKVKTTEDGSFLSGVVYLKSNLSMNGVAISPSVATSLWQDKDLTQSTKVNLSRKGTNPDCNMSIERLDAHDSHAPTFSFQGDMEDYIDRVMTSINLVVELIDEWTPNWTPGEVLPDGGYWAINPDQGGE